MEALTDDDSMISVELRLECMEDFEPEGVVNQVEPLRKLLEARRQLAALLAQTKEDRAVIFAIVCSQSCKTQNYSKGWQWRSVLARQR